MLSTLELLHYCRRFQGTLFAFCFEHSNHCEAVLTDLRVLLAARIQQVIFCAADAELTHTLKRWNRSGDQFCVMGGKVEDLTTTEFIDSIRSEISKGRAPLVALERFPEDELQLLVAQAAIMRCAVRLGAKKIFFPGNDQGLEIDGKFRSYPRVDELRAAISNGATLNISTKRATFFLEQQESHNLDIVLVSARRGAVYEEVFTHSGSGTLFTREYPNILRAADEKDVRDIFALMQPSFVDGSLKRLSEEQLLEIIPSFMVYSVNDQIVAAAALVDHGDSYELGKLCTLPRYQARGRARALVRALLEKARRNGKRSVFALTVHSHVAEFFERLGFVAVDRERLSPTWQAGYDFTRPSRAFEYPLS